MPEPIQSAGSSSPLTARSTTPSGGLNAAAAGGRQADLSLKPPVARVAARKTALGLVCTRSFPAVVGTADMMLKSSGVTLVGYEKTGDGYCTAVVRGNYADVKLAIETGVDTAKKFEQYISSMMLPRPLPNLDTVLPITETFAEYVERAGHFEATGAIGLIETTGFPAMVGASDAAMKCANVELITYETTGAGLCTAVIQGPIADVTMAVEAGMQEAERIGDLHAIMVIPRPLDDLMKVMPKPKHWVEEVDEPQALDLPDPDTVREIEQEPERQPISLPEREAVPVPVEMEVPREQQPMLMREERLPQERRLDDDLLEPNREEQEAQYLDTPETRPSPQIRRRLVEDEILAEEAAIADPDSTSSNPSLGTPLKELRPSNNPPSLPAKEPLRLESSKTELPEEEL